jgi:hypothetical protein
LREWSKTVETAEQKQGTKGNERKEETPVGKTKKPGIDDVPALMARAAADPEVAALLRYSHEVLRLWRLCARNDCQRARGCRGDEVACGAKRWRAARSCFERIRDAGKTGLAAARVVNRHLRSCWSEKNGVLIERREIMFTWRRAT